MTLKQELRGGGFWSDGYSLGTIGEHGSLAILENYVRNQGQQPDEAHPTKFSSFFND